MYARNFGRSTTHQCICVSVWAKQNILSGLLKKKTKLREGGGWIQEEKLGEEFGGKYDQNLLYTCVKLSINKSSIQEGKKRRGFCIS